MGNWILFTNANYSTLSESIYKGISQFYFLKALFFPFLRTAYIRYSKILDNFVKGFFFFLIIFLPVVFQAMEIANHHILTYNK